MSVAESGSGNPGVDLYDAAAMECPFAAYRRLRAVAPVYRVPETGIYVVSRYEDCMEANKHPEIFSSEFASVIAPPPEVMEVFKRGHPMPPTMLTLDPPRHSMYRGLVDKAFAPKRVREMEGYIQAIVDELLAAFIGRGEVELIEAFAAPLPLYIIADQLGVPRADIWKFKRWSDASVVPFAAVASLEERIAAAEDLLEFQEYFVARFEAKRKSPDDDIISLLATTRLEEEDRLLAVPEFLSIAQQMMTAGNETTTNTIAAAMQLLIENPEQMEILRADPDKHARGLVEETLRHQSPVQGMWRIAVRAAELGGVAIPEGAVVNLRYGSANRDEARFEDPDAFDITRRNAARHMAFGYGIHHCVGANLARKEVEIAFRTLIPRMRTISFVPGKNDFAHFPSFTLRGLKALHICFEPAP